MSIIDLAVIVGLFWFCYLATKMVKVLEKDLDN